MQLAFDEQGDVTVVRVQEAKLTYPVLVLVLLRGAPAGRGRGAPGA